jgi:hypothetical protein
VVISGVSYIPPAGGINYSAWFATGFVFQYLVRKRNFAWWSKFNYVTSAALDSGESVPFIGANARTDDTPLGTVLAAIVIFATLEVSVTITVVRWGGSLSMLFSSQMVASILIGGETQFSRTVGVSRRPTCRSANERVHSCRLESYGVQGNTPRGHSNILMYLARHLHQYHHFI